MRCGLVQGLISYQYQSHNAKDANPAVALGRSDADQSVTGLLRRRAVASNSVEASPVAASPVAGVTAVVRNTVLSSSCD